jgi:hypothetical protein
MVLPFIFVFSLYFNALTNEEVTFHNACESFTIEDNRILINASIADSQKVFKLDFGRIESSVNRNINKGTRFYEIDNTLFSGETKFALSPMKRKSCDNIIAINGRFGYDLFRKSRQLFHIDFDASTLCCINDQQKTTLLQRDYHETKSDFRKDGLYITVIIRRKSYNLKFDTGYDGTISMTSDNAEPFIKEACKTYQSIDGNFSIYPNKWVTISGSYYNVAVSVSGGETSRLGIGFLKGFNWIIDFKAQKVYVKKNSVGLDSENDFPPDFQAKAINGKLTVTCKSANATKFGLGSEITKVNGTLVTNENICELQAIIERSGNTNTLDIELFTAN